MGMSRLYPVLFSTVLLVILSAATCKKPLVCIGDCYELHIYGTTLSAVSGIPVGNVPMTLYRRASGGLFNTRRKVIDFQSDANGAIISTASIDTSVLRSRYYFYVELRDNPKWVIQDEGDNVLYDVTQSPFNNYQAKVYERKDLTLKLQDALPGAFTSFSVSCSYDARHNTTPWSIGQPQDIKETTKIIPMASGQWAHIDIYRNDTSGTYTLTRDSVFMTPGATQIPAYIVKY